MAEVMGDFPRWIVVARSLNPSAPTFVELPEFAQKEIRDDYDDWDDRQFLHSGFGWKRRMQSIRTALAGGGVLNAKPYTDEELLAVREATASLGTMGATPYVERLLATIEELRRAREAALERAIAAEAELTRLDTPEVNDFAAAVVMEAAHQRKRWGAEHDAGKTWADWFWLVGYLGGKALTAAIHGQINKALHHTISTAAVLANWHAALLGRNSDMRPGISAEATRNVDAGDDR